ncbi:hypothetical protein AB395_0000401 [Sinorhizobium fredii CCBAU 45436]|nr:hypothetical protein SF83666_c03790 [Sinorhizobium fredii CCBAU 83666]AWI56082.1 hypothetical protein AB395_0000401 [Sinorhizobium fredii CCBAU 45436]AWM23708.1 hypothetical protein AOX55_0000428 [Sinorhizobium fredii CCBAU 25509]
MPPCSCFSGTSVLQSNRLPVKDLLPAQVCFGRAATEPCNISRV